MGCRDTFPWKNGGSNSGGKLVEGRRLKTWLGSPVPNTCQKRKKRLNIILERFLESLTETLQHQQSHFFSVQRHVALARECFRAWDLADLTTVLKRKAVCWLRATKETGEGPVDSPISRHLQQQTKQSKDKHQNNTKTKRKPTHKRGMTGYQFIGRFMQEVTTLCHLIMVWPQTQKREEHQQTQGHTRRWESNTAPCGNQGSPQPGSPRSQGACRKGITTHL